MPATPDKYSFSNGLPPTFAHGVRPPASAKEHSAFAQPVSSQYDSALAAYGAYAPLDVPLQQLHFQSDESAHAHADAARRGSFAEFVKIVANEQQQQQHGGGAAEVVADDAAAPTSGAQYTAFYPVLLDWNEAAQQQLEAVNSAPDAPSTPGQTLDERDLPPTPLSGDVRQLKQSHPPLRRSRKREPTCGMRSPQTPQSPIVAAR